MKTGMLLTAMEMANAREGEMAPMTLATKKPVEMAMVKRMPEEDDGEDGGDEDAVGEMAQPKAMARAGRSGPVVLLTPYSLRAHTPDAIRCGSPCSLPLRLPESADGGRSASSARSREIDVMCHGP